MRFTCLSCFALIFILSLSVESGHAAISFSIGHIYTSNYSSRSISEYSADGTFLRSLTLPTSVADEVRGLAFGRDGLLYASVVRDRGAAVLALRGNGTIEETYSFGTYLRGNLSYGKLAVTDTHIYVAGQSTLTKFQIGDANSATSVYTGNQIFDVDILPSGNLLVASAYLVNEITTTGQLVRNLNPVGPSLTDVRGVEYDPVSDKIFVTHLGHTGFFHRIMRIDAGTRALESDTYFNYADDLFLATSGELLVGSRSQVPSFYSQSLEQGSNVGTRQQMFVTQLVPEPRTDLLLSVGSVLGFILFVRQKRHFQRSHCS